MTTLSAKLMRAKRELEAAEGSRLTQEDELHALRQQVMMLRANLSNSEEARTEAFAKLNGVFHGDEAQWMTRELLLIDEIGELEEVIAPPRSKLAFSSPASLSYASVSKAIITLTRCACVHVCVRACACVRVCACMRACARARVCVLPRLVGSHRRDRDAVATRPRDQQQARAAGRD